MAYSGINLTEGSGPKQSSSDTVGGREFQRIKPAVGPEGTAIDVQDAAPMPTQEIGGAMSLLSRILQVLLSPMGFDRSLSRSRVTCRGLARRAAAVVT